MSPVSVALLMAALLAVGLVAYLYAAHAIHGSERKVSVETLEAVARQLQGGGVTLPGGAYLEERQATLWIDEVPVSVSLARVVLPGCRGLTIDPSRYNASLAPWGNGTACGVESKVAVTVSSGVAVVEYYTPNSTGLFHTLTASPGRREMVVWASTISTPWGNVSLGSPVEVVVVEREVGGS